MLLDYVKLEMEEKVGPSGSGGGVKGSSGGGGGVIALCDL